MNRHQLTEVAEIVAIGVVIGLAIVFVWLLLGTP